MDIKAFLKRKNIEISAKRYGIDALSAMAQGLFASLLIGTIFGAIGMIPPVLVDRIQPIGNAAGEGAKLCALSNAEYGYSKALASGVEFLELASLPEFNDCYVECLCFEEEEE